MLEALRVAVQNWGRTPNQYIIPPGNPPRKSVIVQLSSIDGGRKLSMRGRGGGEEKQGWKDNEERNLSSYFALPASLRRRERIRVQTHFT